MHMPEFLLTGSRRESLGNCWCGVEQYVLIPRLKWQAVLNPTHPLTRMLQYVTFSMVIYKHAWAYATLEMT